MSKLIAASSTGFIFSVLFVVSAAAQGYVIQSPGQSPTFVNPLGNDRYIIQSPGQRPTFVNPTGNGGYVVQTPGQSPSFINPTTPSRPCIHDMYGRC